ncbi:hypothetical protein LTV02_17815 [Nocardia yamanashiensis]|uniref:DUF7373 family lipoprotein n=1 Tax=Nocardia yamanashiensis TaxID=209247 RepID=UPI001E6289B3|nr:hypothetical protein [Nocardia yamanashiensis]UGT45129.1 hypothetical protein LTV02_17815 [Nocardia yamanashiensis]
MRRSERPLRWLPALLAAALLAGCASTVPGTPGPARDLAKLDVGGWDTTPLPVPATSNVSYGRILESVRMAEAVIGPAELDPVLEYPVTALVPTPLATVGIIADVARPILAEYGMVAGYSMTGADTLGELSTINRKSSLVRVTVIGFPDAAAADSAAQRIEEADFAAGAGNEAVEIPGFAAAHSHWRPDVPTLGVYAAHGSFLIALYIRLPEPDLTALTTLAAAALTAQQPKLDGFTPTPLGRLAELPLDADDMLRRMVPMRTGQWSYPSLSRRENLIDEVSVAIGMRMSGGITLGPGGIAHELRGNKNQRGIERRAVIGNEVLYRFADASAARGFFTILRNSTGDAAGDAPATANTGPAGVPDAFCYTDDASGITPFETCFVLDGRYVATIVGPDRAFAHQRTAAEYALLVNTR